LFCSLKKDIKLDTLQLKNGVKAIFTREYRIFASEKYDMIKVKKVFCAWLMSLVLMISSLGFGQNYTRVNSIRVSGNLKTHTAIVLRELPFKVGDSLEVKTLDKTLERAKQNVFNTNLFTTVELLQNQTTEGVQITIILKERWYFLALPMAMLADRSFNEWWYDRNHDFSRLTYGITAKHFNLSGNNDQLRIKAFLGFIPYFELSYFKPYIDKRKRIGLRTGLFYSSQRTMAFRTWHDKLDFFATDKRMIQRKGGFMELRLRNALYNFNTAYFGFSKISLADTIAKLNPYYFGKGVVEQNTFTFIYDYLYERKDNKQYPLKGKSFYAQMANFWFLKNSVPYQLNLVVAYNQYIQLSKKIYFETNSRIKWSSPNQQHYPFVSGFGYGNNWVRGYELYVIDGQHTALQRNTLKYQALKRNFDLGKIIKLKQFNSFPLAIYPTLYFDMGYVKNFRPILSQSSLANTFLYGGGVGMDFISWYNTNFKTFYSINPMGEKRFYFGVFRNL
jgi:Surface antigen variable number repeat